MKNYKTVFFILIVCFIITLGISSCTSSDEKASPTSNILFVSPTVGIVSSSHTLETTPAPTPTQKVTQSPTQATTQTVAPTATQTATQIAAQTAEPTPVPTGDIQLSFDYAEATGDKSKFTNRAPLKQVSFTVKDPYNTQNLSTTRIGHWFGSNTAQPIKFQKQYESKGWPAITIDTKTTEKVIYLTFDCGYENGHTEKILNTLKEKNCPAAFFVTLGYVESCPGLTARMIEDGHIVGNHSSNHPDFSKISKERMAREIQKLDNYLRVYFGYTSPYFRYPTGAYSDCSMELLSSIGYRAVFWSYAYNDYTEGAFPGKDLAFKYVTNRLHPGEVLLLHAISPGNADALGDIIDYARAQGYEFKSLDDYFEEIL